MKNKSTKPHSKSKTEQTKTLPTNATMGRAMHQRRDKDGLRAAFAAAGAVKGLSMHQKALGHQEASAVTARYYDGSSESEWARQFMKLTPKTVLGRLCRPLRVSQLLMQAKPKNSKSKKSKPKSKNK